MKRLPVFTSLFALAAAVDSLAEAALRGEVEGAPAVLGLTVGIARNGAPARLRGYGLADVKAVTERTVGDQALHRGGGNAAGGSGRCGAGRGHP